MILQRKRGRPPKTDRRARFLRYEHHRAQNPRNASVLRTGRLDCSTRRTISIFSRAGYLIPRRPHRGSCFFEQADLKRLFGNYLFPAAGP